MLHGILSLSAIRCVFVLAALATADVSRTPHRSPVAPRDERVKAVVNEAYGMFRNDASGKNADYIPYLAKVDPKLFGIAVVTTDNRVYTLGDVEYSFSIQSISKVFTLALVIQELGAGKVFERVGSEPTGRPFNSVSAVVEMGATLANNGVNPVTGGRVMKAEDIPEILATMTMAGLYDGSGGWAWHVGLPAKSGVGGGILAVVPGKGAIAVFAPPLDEAGNSVKAQKVISFVANKLDMNLYSPASVGMK